MKKIFVTITLLGLVLNLLGQSSILALVNKPDQKQIRVTVKTDITVYVGLTINPDTDNETNFNVQKVDPGNGLSYLDFDVSKIHKDINVVKSVIKDINTYTENHIENESFPYTVALWQNKISIAKCILNNGKPCKYCKDKGFHLEDRIDIESARYFPNGKYEVIDTE